MRRCRHTACSASCRLATCSLTCSLTVCPVATTPKLRQIIPHDRCPRALPTRALPLPPPQLRAAEDKEGRMTYFEENPRMPYRGAKIMSSQPQFLNDFSTGLNTTAFQ